MTQQAQDALAFANALTDLVHTWEQRLSTGIICSVLQHEQFGLLFDEAMTAEKMAAAYKGELGDRP